MAEQENIVRNTEDNGPNTGRDRDEGREGTGSGQTLGEGSSMSDSQMSGSQTNMPQSSGSGMGQSTGGSSTGASTGMAGGGTSDSTYSGNQTGAANDTSGASNESYASKMGSSGGSDRSDPLETGGTGSSGPAMGQSVQGSDVGSGQGTAARQKQETPSDSGTGSFKDGEFQYGNPSEGNRSGAMTEDGSTSSQDYTLGGESGSTGTGTADSYGTGQEGSGSFDSQGGNASGDRVKQMTEEEGGEPSQTDGSWRPSDTPANEDPLQKTRDTGI